MRLTKKFIKSHIPSKFYDGSKLNGVSLETNSYDLFIRDTNGIKEFVLRTTSYNPLLKVLDESGFNVRFVKHWWAHYSEYLITLK